MATTYRTTLIPSIAILKPVDNGAENLLFGTRRYFETQQVEFDAATISGTTAGYNSFANSANVVKKDGFDTIRLNPLNINESINITGENTKNKGFGESIYGGNGTTNPALRSELEGFGKLKARAERAKKKAMYEAMITGKIVYGQDGIAEIDFNMPTENKKVLTGSDVWSDASSDPVTDLVTAYDAMDITPTDAILSQTAYSAFMVNPNVRFESNTDGKSRNVVKNDMPSSKGAKFIYVGRLADRPLDLWLEIDKYTNDSGSKAPYMTDDYVVIGSSDATEMLYGGIPMIQGEDVVHVATEFMPEVNTESNPAKVDRVFKTSPLPTIKSGSAFYSLKAL